MKEPTIAIGILSGREIRFSLPESTVVGGQTDGQPIGSGQTVEGKQSVACKDNRVVWHGQSYDELLFTPTHPEAVAFELEEVTIGIDFHWERKENQCFRGTLKLIAIENQLTAINLLPIEEYLTSVISSEMSATASLELLKAHAVISRSWAINKLKERPDKATAAHQSWNANPCPELTDTERIRWYDHEAHTHFHLCADDHCQRYQGITRASTPQVARAIAATRGEVLTHEGAVCDTRFSKCCGGAFEEFQYCWENTPRPYLKKQRDSQTESTLPDLRIEAEAEQWIRTTPPAFCRTQEKSILHQVLNNYDRETTDFYRWKVSYRQAELAELMHRRSGIDLGEIIDLIPLERGTSGRLIRLKIVGSKRSLILGKELEIRRTLSASHLYSAAFVIDREEVRDGVPERFVLTGAGWGHGVGLCQIGAAVMGEQGYRYDEILAHYYPGATLEKLFE